MTQEALKLALEALEELFDTNGYWWQEVDEQTLEKIDQAITAIKEALAQHDSVQAKPEPEQEPMAWMSEHRFDELRKGFTVMTTLTKQRAFKDDVAIYTTPPQRTWVGLTDEEIKKIAKKHRWHESNVAPHLMPVFRSLEAKLKERNT